MKNTVLKSKNGVTLIALVATIIILLILAGVSIATLTGDSSIIRKASETQILTELSNVEESLEIYKIQKHSDGDMSDEELVEDGVLKEVLVKDTYRTLGIIIDLEEIDIKGKLGKSGAKLEETEVETLQNLYDVYAIDMTNGTLYYIRDGIWSTEGAKVTYIAENGEEKEGYEIETVNQEYLESKKFITEWTVEAGTIITLPITRVPDITIEWGDGTTLDCTTIQPTHTYEETGTYEIKIAGNMEAWSFENIKTSKDYITAIKQWGNTNYQIINFANCTNLAGIIPSVEQNTFENVTSFNQLFYNCENLTGSIPEDLFKNCTQATNFQAIFRGCKGISGPIPEKLFNNCIEATSFGNAFQECTGLTGEIPEGLFSNCSKVTSFGNIFNGCKSLEGNIPENLFANCTEVTEMGRVFSGCSGLIGNIPENLFINCLKISSLNETFNGCSGLTGNIPENLFGNQTSITNFYGTFSGCKGLTGNAPKLWERDNVTTYTYCFRYCTNLSNYNEIPSAWGGGGQ